MLQSIIVYGFLLISLMILGFHVSKRSLPSPPNLYSFYKWEIILSIVIFTIVAGIRYDVGVDYLSYLSYYNQIDSGVSQEIEVEFFFKYLAIFFTENNFHFTFFYATIAFIQISFIYLTFRKELYLLPYVIFIFLTNGLFFSYMGGLRQTIVCSIFLFSIQYIKSKNLFLYFLFIFVAYFFHKSALLLAPLYFILNLKSDWFKSRFLQLALLVAAAYLSTINIWEHSLLYLSNIVKLLGYNQQYGDIELNLTRSNIEFSRGIRFYAPLIIYIINAILSTKIKSIFSNTAILIFYNLYFIGALSNFLFYNNFLLKRPMMYFTTMAIVVCSYTLLYLVKKTQTNTNYMPLLLIYVILHLAILYAFIASDFHTQYLFFWE